MSHNLKSWWVLSGDKSSQIFSSDVIHDTARWQFCSTTQVPSFTAFSIGRAATGPWIKNTSRRWPYVTSVVGRNAWQIWASKCATPTIKKAYQKPNTLHYVKWRIYGYKQAQFCLHVMKNTKKGWESLRTYLSLSKGYGIKLVAAEAFIGCELHQTYARQTISFLPYSSKEKPSNTF